MAFKNNPDGQIHEMLAQRYSPYQYSDKVIADPDLLALFEAARWSASSFNEQPWSYLVARKADGKAFDEMLSCLVEGNRGWAQVVPVLAIGVYTKAFKKNGQPNSCAAHDLGQASANMAIEAVARGLQIHQMSGILPDRCREVYKIPEGSDALTGIAIGYPGANPALPEKVAERDKGPGQRKAITDFVFGGAFGTAASFTKHR
jgi:nitroreductase